MFHCLKMFSLLPSEYPLISIYESHQRSEHSRFVLIDDRTLQVIKWTLVLTHWLRTGNHHTSHMRHIHTPYKRHDKTQVRHMYANISSLTALRLRPQRICNCIYTVNSAFKDAPLFGVRTLKILDNKHKTTRGYYRFFVCFFLLHLGTSPSNLNRWQCRE